MIKKLFTLFICSISLALTFTGCSEEAFDTDSVNKQTILVFYPWTGDKSSTGLLGYLQNNIDSICDGIIDRKGLNNSRVLVFLSDKYNHSTLYDLQYNATTKSVDRVPLKEYEGASYASAEGIADIMNEVKTQASALNYALIVGVHGCGWTYASDWSRYPYYARPSVTRPSDNNFSGIQFGPDPNAPLTRFFGSVSLAENAMDISTLAEGIRESGLKMQYILFDACYMSNIETAYELKDVTNYMIASGSEIMAAGLPYRSMWSYLNSPTPNYSGIVSTSVNFYKNNSSAPFCNLAAIDCRQVEKLASVMKDINAEYQLSASVSLDSIQHLDGFRPNLFYDLETYVDSLHPSGYLLDQFKSQLKLTIKASDHTDEAYTCIYSSDSFKIKNYCGITISDPSQHSVAIKGREKTGWWKATH
ncbi:clostripain-related cysteine peptidase [Segatella copri]|uniref:clostripain-related cysteine peptidase n=1 Tax=Segatella copri TaxID=165179 RepID=UPI003F6F5BF9